MDYFKSNWFKIILTIFIGAFLFILAKKLIGMEISLGVTDFLSIILALFSIGLSVAFYFKSTDQSNKFYDDTVKFTKDTSTILGEIQAGFGEKLTHLSQENIVIRNSIEGVKEAISQKENRVHTDREELNTVLAAISLLEQQKSTAKPDDTEQYEKTINNLKKTVNNKETEIAQLQNDLEELKNKKKQALKLQHIKPIHPIKEDYAIITCDVCKHTIGLASSYIKNNSFTKDGALHTYCPDCATVTKVIY
ncbi:hypothetical protein CON03_27570 [Bacillus cereus]|uniref:hypothetical protein n=1 Tax=Bacillus cereus TaxID=1396 RepID=UPI000BEDD1A7|nr:hypothetical protein [Bacillus cereus]PDZ02664.1 hypothetical protein CON03_27570 [Bacillus cereus]PFN11670.1 hypothetical protein COJ72_30740 [Bacillus cereus]PFS85407.1 hypothetical protein COK56_00400 [Bacillus cereus]PGU48383.1 hypothetical protein COD91_01505 [Bacillus cereus]